MESLEEVFSEGASELGPVLELAGSDALALDEALSEILKYSLLRRRSKRQHPRDPPLGAGCVEAMRWTRRHSGYGRNGCASRKPCISEGGIFYLGASANGFSRRCYACAELINQWSFEFPEAARLLNQAGFYLEARGRYTDAKPLCERALAIREKALGPEHPDVATSLNNLAGLYVEPRSIREGRAPLPAGAGDPGKGPGPGAPRRGHQPQQPGGAST